MASEAESLLNVAWLAKIPSSLCAKSGRVRRSYVCAEDVARFMVNALGRAEARNRLFEIGGPEALSQMDVVAIFERVLGRKLEVRRTPVVALKGRADASCVRAPAVMLRGKS